MTQRMVRGSVWERQSTLIETCVAWLQQALELLSRLDDATYTASPRELAPHRAGSHLRHILEFYECLLDGLEGAHVDYDARRRDTLVEQSRSAAAAKITSIIDRLQAEELLRRDAVLWVRMEDAAGLGISDGFLLSSTGRELQVLSSHTIHHFALISATLRSLGFPVSTDFGMAPSTLRYQRSVRVA